MDLSFKVLSECDSGSHKVYLSFQVRVTHFGCNRVQIKVNISMFGWDGIGQVFGVLTTDFQGFNTLSLSFKLPDALTYNNHVGAVKIAIVHYFCYTHLAQAHTTQRSFSISILPYTSFLRRCCDIRYPTRTQPDISLAPATRRTERQVGDFNQPHAFICCII